MKLLCVSSSYWPAFQYGGPIAAVHGLNKSLVKKGVDVTVYTTNTGLNGKVPTNCEVSVDGVKVRYFNFVKSLDFLGDTGWQFSLKMLKTLQKHLKDFDIVHIVGLWNFPVGIASYYSDKLKKPYVISPHGALRKYALSKRGWKKKPYYFLFTKRNLANAMAIHYFTKFEMKSSHQALGFKNDTAIVPNGIDLEDFDNLPSKQKIIERYPVLKDKVVILFLGRIHWIKGIDILSKVFASIARDREKLHLLIVGNDESGYESMVRQWIQEEGVEKQTTFTGILKGQEKLEALTGSDIFVLPSYSEGFSMAILEAMACRLPVVISKQCHFPEVAKSNAGIIVDSTQEELALALRKLLDFPELRKQMGENGRRIVEKKYTWDKVAEQMIEVYQDIINCKM